MQPWREETGLSCCGAALLHCFSTGIRHLGSAGVSFPEADPYAIHDGIGDMTWNNRRVAYEPKRDFPQPGFPHPEACHLVGVVRAAVPLAVAFDRFAFRPRRVINAAQGRTYRSDIIGAGQRPFRARRPRWSQRSQKGSR